jgi:hypothetical protein
MTLEVPEDWFDTTEDDAPFTLSKPEGVGALQFSVAQYHEGTPPSVDAAALSSLLRDFATSQSFSDMHDAVQEQAELSLAAASFSLDEEFFGRVWYVSDGWSVAKVTYTCEHALLGPELHDAETIGRSMRFSNGDA